MLALLRKDFRVSQAAVWGSIIVGLGIHLVTLIIVLTTTEYWVRDAYASNMFMGAGMVGLWLSAILAAAYGGIAFAAERRERSADFLAMLPAPRAQIVLSKCIVAFACPLAIWLINASVVATAAAVVFSPSQDNDLRYILLLSFEMLVMCFGLAWLLSSFLTSSAISASVSIGVAIASSVLIGMWCERVRLNHDWLRTILAVWMLAVGILSFIAGTIHYLRRVES